MSMKLIEVPPLEGALNINHIIRPTKGPLLLQRNPRDNPQILRSIAHEYHFIGFTDLGGKFRRRSFEEQVLFTRHAASQGLHILPPNFVRKSAAYFPFLRSAATLDDFLPTASQESMAMVMLDLFDDLRTAHKKSIIYGDRWSRNILVLPDSSFLHVDFDIEISGRYAKEFEVAQVLYYTLCAGRERSLPLICRMMAKENRWFDINVVQRFLEGHAIHFINSPKYGSAEALVDSLIEAIRQ